MNDNIENINTEDAPMDANVKKIQMKIILLK